MLTMFDLISWLNELLSYFKHVYDHCSRSLLNPLQNNFKYQILGFVKNMYKTRCCDGDESMFYLELNTVLTLLDIIVLTRRE